MALKYRDVAELYAQNPELKKSDVLALMEWAKKEPHLPEMEGFIIFHSFLFPRVFEGVLGLESLKFPLISA